LLRVCLRWVLTPGNTTSAVRLNWDEHHSGPIIHKAVSDMSPHHSSEEQHTIGQRERFAPCQTRYLGSDRPVQASGDLIYVQSSTAARVRSFQRRDCVHAILFLLCGRKTRPTIADRIKGCSLSRLTCRLTLQVCPGRIPPFPTCP
jgi:hypothetical protein